VGEWWINNVGQNLLTGTEDDEDNPAALSDIYIAHFFHMIPEARASYSRLRVGLTAAEQARLDTLLENAVSVTLDPVIFSDAIQSKWNREGVRTAGPRGGTRIGGNR